MSTVRRPRTGHSRVAAAAAALLCLPAACGGGSETQPPPPVSPLLPVMTEMRDLALGHIDPFLRNRTQLPAIAEAGRRMLELAQDEAFAAYPHAPAFQGRPEHFEAKRQRLRGSLENLVYAAETENLEALSDAWSIADGTCIDCHKRYDPNY